MNDCSGDRDECFEAGVCFARAHSYPSVFLQFAKVVFDQVPPFVGVFVELRRELPVGLRRNDRSDVAIQQVIAQPKRCSLLQRTVTIAFLKRKRPAPALGRNRCDGPFFFAEAGGHQHSKR